MVGGEDGQGDQFGRDQDVEGGAAPVVGRHHGRQSREGEERRQGDDDAQQPADAGPAGIRPAFETPGQGGAGDQDVGPADMVAHQAEAGEPGEREQHEGGQVEAE